MEVKVLGEYGYDIAIRGFGYSFMDSAANPEEYYTPEKLLRIEKAALAHVGKGKGMDKWIRQVAVYLDIRAPRYWFSEFDTYKIGTVAQSTSTMHTLSRRDMNVYDLEQSVEQDIQQEQVACFNKAKGRYINSIGELKKYVPESYLQRRVVSLNYAVLREMIRQRSTHRLPEWKVFIDALYAQCEHPELLPRRD